MKVKPKSSKTPGKDVQQVHAYFVQRKSDLKFLTSVYAIGGRVVAEEVRWSDDISEAWKVPAGLLEFFVDEPDLILNPILRKR